MSNVEKTLEQHRAALEGAGVRDVKFFFTSVSDKSFSELAHDVLTVVDAIVAKKHVPMDVLKDDPVVVGK